MPLGSSALGSAALGGFAAIGSTGPRHAERTVFLGHDMLLFRPSPNWQTSSRLQVTAAVEVQRGLTGRENRAALHTDLRHRLRASWWLPREEYRELDTNLWTLGEAYIGVPMCMDQLVVERWGERMFDAAYVLNYDDSGWVIYAADSIPPAPPHAWLAPLFVGRLRRRPTMEAVNQYEVEMTIEVDERSPWDFAISPAPAVVGPDWPASLEVDWSRPVTTTTEDTLVYEDIGDGRVRAVDGQEGVTRRRQRFPLLLSTRAEVRSLLNFFAERGGRAESFVIDWVTTPSDVETAATPHRTRVRFASDTLTLDFLTDQVASTTIDVVQLPWEVDGVAGETPAQASEAYLYRFTRRADVAVVTRYTSWGQDLTRTADGTYTAALIEHDRISQGYLLDDDTVSITSWVSDGNPLLLVTQRALDVPLEVEIFRCDPADVDNTAELLYQGEIVEVENTGRKLVASAMQLGGRLDIKVPAFDFSPGCNYEFCGPGCGLDIADHTRSGTIAAINGNAVDIILSPNPADHDYFARGWARIGTSATYEVRQIVRSTNLGGTGLRLTLKRAFRGAAVGQTLTLAPTCLGTWEECKTKYDNAVNFGGHPHIGPKNLSVPRRVLNDQGTKK